MKRPANTSAENLEALTQEEISEKQLEDLNYFIASNRTRDYFLLKKRMGDQIFANALKKLFFHEMGVELKVKTNNPFQSAMRDVLGSACSYGIGGSYAFHVMDLSDDSTQLDVSALEPFIFTLALLPGNQFKVLINRLDNSIEIDVGNFFEKYRTYDIRTIETSRIMGDFAMEHAVAADHFIYQDILTTVEKFLSLKHAYDVLSTVPYDALCQALGVAKTSFLKFILDFVSHVKIKPYDFIEKDNFLLLRTAIVGGSFNKYHPPIEPTQKLELLFSHLDKRPCMHPDSLIEFLHPYINMGIRIPNHEAVTFLLAKVNQSLHQILFEKANYELFITAYHLRNTSMMSLIASLLPNDLQRKFFALFYLLTYSELEQQAACWALTRDKLLEWVNDLLKKTTDEKLISKYTELQQIMNDRKSKTTMKDPTSYQLSDREYELHPPICTTTEDNYHQTLQLLPITHEQMTSMFEWFRMALPDISNRFQGDTPQDWQKNITYLFTLLDSISKYPKANHLSFKFMPIEKLYYQELLREHLQITDKEQPNSAIQQFFQRGEFRAPLWTHQLDVQHCSKLEAKTVSVMGTLWHAETLKAVKPLYDNNRRLNIDTNFALIKMTFIVTTKEERRTKLELPISMEQSSYIHCTSNTFQDQKAIYNLYKAHGKKIVGDNHSDSEEYAQENIPHSEKTFVYYLHQDVLINAIVEKLTAFKKLHAIILDIISTNQCCKTCQLMLIGLQNSHNLENGFLSRLGNALTNKVTTPQKSSIRMITRYSSFQPMRTNATNVTGNTPDVTPKYETYFRKNTIFYSNSHLEPALPWHPIGSPPHLKQFSEEQQRRAANTAASIHGNDDIIHEQYHQKHNVQYCGTQPLSLKQLCDKDRKNRVILCAPQKSTELYLKKPASIAVKLGEFSLFCSGNNKVPAIEEKWNELRGPDSNAI